MAKRRVMVRVGRDSGKGYTYVAPTTEEKAEWDHKYPGRAGSRPWRVQCVCGKRYWLSGIAVGSHRNACPGAPS